jgi:pimeloyl-ACP methyl ester carboxylesterase
VRALVLDSVVPHTGFDPLGLETMQATARVLRAACVADPTCTTDPAEDLAWLVRHGEVEGEPVDTTRLLDAFAILSLSRIDPSFSGIPAMLHAAREGDKAGLTTFLTSFTGFMPARDLSAGLHLTTLCADLRFPWGDAAAPLGGRRAALEQTLADLNPGDVWPYDLETARNILPISGCLRWPSAKPALFSDGGRLEPPTLILHGDRDLFCPLVWAEREAEAAVQADLVIVAGGGHGLQGSPSDPTGRREVTAFLLGL